MLFRNEEDDNQINLQEGDLFWLDEEISSFADINVDQFFETGEDKIARNFCRYF